MADAQKINSYITWSCGDGDVKHTPSAVVSQAISEYQWLMRCTLCRKSVRESWDPRKTLRQNLSSLGLAFDANATVPLRTTKEEDEQVGY